MRNHSAAQTDELTQVQMTHALQDATNLGKVRFDMGVGTHRNDDVSTLRNDGGIANDA